MMAEHIQTLSIRELQEFSSSLQNSAVNLYKLLENLLDWSKIQRGLIKYNPEEFILSNIINNSIEIVKSLFKEKSIKLISNISENLVVNVDLTMFNSILRNLIENAIKFTRKNGLIEIGTIIMPKTSGNNKKGFVTIFIKDNGIGMDRETVNNLFKLTEKVSRPGTDGELSSGIGLLLCKEFVDIHGCKIWVDSHEGIGSTFYFTVPGYVQI